MFYVSFEIVQPVNASEWKEKDLSSNSEVLDNELEILQDEQNEMIYRVEEDGVTFEYHEEINGNIVYTKKYRIVDSVKTLVEDYETNVNVTADTLLLSTFDNLTEITEQVEINLEGNANVDFGYFATRASCTLGHLVILIKKHLKQ